MTTSTWFASDTPDAQERLVQVWSDAPIENEELCGMLLDVAQTQVLSYAPPVETEEEAEDLYENPPVRYVYAQLEQAKRLWNAGRADENGNVGTEGFSFVPRPLDKTVKAIIRPQSGAADVF
ncbi:hypothetical protein [Microbacterium sp. PRC9]|uniref:hypothetical protein n=1 Tax=Microbacterium sp. PRC9 TaxID=2962591 RepID=UPI0028819CCD|nr:hypothetical protein [Microbacterium sp. PRC9]MDT0142791.1 hypothetical protein [Microbacterium sp. PRC9]